LEASASYEATDMKIVVIGGDGIGEKLAHKLRKGQQSRRAEAVGT
jgi:hypothetical protein